MPLLPSILRRFGRAIEISPLTKGAFVPEQILSRTPQGKQLYDFTVRNQRLFRLTAERFKKRVDKIVDKYNLHDDDSINKMLALVEFPYYVGRAPTPFELSQIPRPIVQAARDHLKYVTDPIWRMARKYDPEIGYVPGYFTHFPIRNQVNVIKNEISDLVRTIDEIRKSGDSSALNTLSSLEATLSHLRQRLSRLETINAQIAQQRAQALEATLAAQRWGVRPTSGYFGPLDEARRARDLWGYSTNYRDIMHDYIDGAFRKMFLDKYSRTANNIARSIENPAYREYAYEYITAQRGALGAKTRLFLNEAMRQIAPAAEAEASGKILSRAVDYATRFQYLTKIGLSWFRFPLVNITQPLLTTYPLVGEKIFTKAFYDLFNPRIWKEAERFGIVFEPTVRKAVTEFLGRGGPWAKVERYLTFPAELSEKTNRVWSFAAGLRQAKEMGLKGHEAIRHAINLVNRTQFLYHTEAMPLWTRNPVGRLVMQFRTFISNYTNYLIQVFKEGTTAQKMRALGSLAVLSGSSAIPMWDEVRETLLRNVRIDIGEYNPIEFATEQLGLQPGINIGTSLEPWNFPYTIYNLLGPTIGPLTETMFKLRQQPEKSEEILKNFIQRLSPAVTATYKGLFEPVARTKPTLTQPQGRIIGERPLLERLYLRPSIENQRRHYIRLMANAIVARRPDLIRQYQEEMRKVGIRVSPEDVAEARRQATEHLKRRRF